MTNAHSCSLTSVSRCGYSGILLVCSIQVNALENDATSHDFTHGRGKWRFAVHQPSWLDTYLSLCLVQRLDEIFKNICTAKCVFETFLNMCLVK
jgi:hypothetical protein